MVLSLALRISGMPPPLLDGKSAKSWGRRPAGRGYVGCRVGEARVPGPYTVGGASGSGGGWVHVRHQKWEKASGDASVSLHGGAGEAAGPEGNAVLARNEDLAESQKRVGAGRGMGGEAVEVASVTPERGLSGKKRKVASSGEAGRRGVEESRITEELRHRIERNRLEAVRRKWRKECERGMGEVSPEIAPDSEG